MTGEELYQHYVNANNDNGISVDDWWSLDETDQDVWNAMAAELFPN